MKKYWVRSSEALLCNEVGSIDFSTLLGSIEVVLWKDVKPKMEELEELKKSINRINTTIFGFDERMDNANGKED